MAEYVERDAVLALSDDFELTLDDDEIFFEYIPVKGVKELPAADVAPVRRGRWMEEHLSSTSGGFYAVVRCSECRSQFPTIYKTPYCPSCGADMRGAK